MLSMFLSPCGYSTLLLRFCQSLEQGVFMFYLPGHLSSQVAHPLQVVSAVTVIFKGLQCTNLA